MIEVKSHEDFLRLKAALHTLADLCGNRNDHNFLMWFIDTCVHVHNYPDPDAGVVEYPKPELRLIHADKK